MKPWRNIVAAAIQTVVLATLIAPSSGAWAHHVLGRPAYQLNEDSNTPSAIQGEVMIGGYLANYMVFPAFPKPGQPGRISFHASGLEDGHAFEGKVSFWVGESSGLGAFGLDPEPHRLGVQNIDDGVFRQAFTFAEAGDYLVSIRFTSGGEPHAIDFPLRVGAGPGLGMTSVLAICLVVALGLVLALAYRRQAMTGRIRETLERGEAIGR